MRVYCGTNVGDAVRVLATDRPGAGDGVAVVMSMPPIPPSAGALPGDGVGEYDAMTPSTLHATAAAARPAGNSQIAAMLTAHPALAQ